MREYRARAQVQSTQQRKVYQAVPPAATFLPRGRTQQVLQLQQTLGNREVGRFLQAKRLTPEGGIIGLQRKLTVGAANDQYEQEADRVARQVLNTSHAVAGQSLQRAMAPEDDKDQKIQTKPLAVSITSLLQRQGMNTEEPDDKEETVQAKSLAGTSSESVQRQPETDEEEKTIQTKSVGALAGSFDAETNVESQISQSKGHGSPLPEQVRAYMEPRFGADFSHVRVHTGSEAIQMTRDVSAQAFTHGSDIYFGAGSSPNNLELTAHELTHVVQQTGSVPLQTKRLDGASTTNVGLSLQRVCSACAAGDKEEKASVPISPGSISGVQRSLNLRGSDPSDRFEQDAKTTAAPVISRPGSGKSASPDVGPIQRRPVSDGRLQRKVFAQTQGDFRATFSPQGAVTGTGLAEPVDLSYSKDADTNAIHSESVEIPDKTTGDITLTVFSSWGSSHVLPPPNKQNKCEPCDLLKEKIGAQIPIVPKAGFFEIVSDQFKQACQTKRNFTDKAKFTRKVLDTLEKDPCALKDTTETVLCNATEAGIEFANKTTPFVNPFTKLEDQVKAIAAKLGEMELLCEEDPLEVMNGGGQTQFNVAFAFDETGNLQASGPQPVTQSRGAGAQVETNGLKETNTEGALASLTVTIRYTNIQTVGNQQIPNATSFTQQFNVNLTKPVPPPDVQFHCGDQLKPFKVASDQLEREDHEIETLFDWFMCLPQVVREQVQAGQLPIKVSGFASRTGGNAFNFNLAQKRADKAEKLIRGFAGTGAKITKFAFGEEPAPNEGKKPKKEDPSQRRADIEIEGVIPGKKAGDLTTDTACGVNGPFVPDGGEEPPRQDCVDNDKTPEADDAPKA